MAILIREFLGGDFLAITGLEEGERVVSLKTLHRHQFVIETAKKGDHGSRFFFCIRREVPVEISSSEKAEILEKGPWKEISLPVW